MTARRPPLRLMLGADAIGAGRLERIMILDDGYAWNGSVYRSLSRVAKAITGTNWNGHRFFGLKAVRDRASMPKSGLSGSVRGAPSDGRPYRDRGPRAHTPLASRV